MAKVKSISKTSGKSKNSTKTKVAPKVKSSSATKAKPVVKKGSARTKAADTRKAPVKDKGKTRAAAPRGGPPMNISCRSVTIRWPYGLHADPNESVYVFFNPEGVVSPYNGTIYAQVFDTSWKPVTTELSASSHDGTWRLGPFLKPDGTTLDANTEFFLKARFADDADVHEIRIRTR